MNFPSAYKTREDKIKVLKPNIIKVVLKDNNIFIYGNTNSHKQIILFYLENTIIPNGSILSSIVNIDTPIKVECDCQSFKYEFEYVLGNDNLVYPRNFNMNSGPREKNPLYIKSGCKHIIALGRYIDKNKHTINIS